MGIPDWARICKVEVNSILSCKPRLFIVPGLLSTFWSSFFKFSSVTFVGKNPSLRTLSRASRKLSASTFPVTISLLFLSAT